MCERWSEMMEDFEEIHIYGTAKVGERGQIVIPSKARKDLNVKPGDLLLVFKPPDGKPGIVLIKADVIKEHLGRLLKRLEEPEEGDEIAQDHRKIKTQRG